MDRCLPSAAGAELQRKAHYRQRRTELTSTEQWIQCRALVAAFHGKLLDIYFIFTQVLMRYLLLPSKHTTFPPQKSSHDNMTNLAYLCVGMVLGLLEIMIEIVIRSVFCIDFLAV